MDPKWVMTNDEKRIRFKKFFKKKDEQSSANEVPAQTTSTIRATRKRRMKASPEEQLQTDLNSDSSHLNR